MRAAVPDEVAPSIADLSSFGVQERLETSTRTEGRDASTAQAAHDALPPVAEALEYPARLRALACCDVAAQFYDPDSFSIALSWRGRNTAAIVAPIGLLILWGIAWALILERSQALREIMIPLEDVYAPLSTTVSFLVVFRLGRAGVRYWDARAAAGKMVEVCRVLASDSAIVCSSDPELRDRFARWIAVFPVVVKNFVRPAGSSCDRIAELVPLVSHADACALLDAESCCGPLYVLNQLRLAAYDVSQLASLEPSMRSMAFRELATSLNVLTGAWGAMERINATPLPYVYVAHLRSLLLLYLAISYVEALSRFSWAAFPGLLVCSWALLGIEAAAVECERPFRRRPNHLLLGKFACVVARHLRQTLRDVDRTTSTPTAPSSSAQ